MSGMTTWLCLLVTVFALACFAAEPDYKEPPQDMRYDQKGEWVFKRRFESIQKAGKDGEKGDRALDVGVLGTRTHFLDKPGPEVRLGEQGRRKNCVRVPRTFASPEL